MTGRRLLSSSRPYTLALPLMVIPRLLLLSINSVSSVVRIGREESLEGTLLFLEVIDTKYLSLELKLAEGAEASSGGACIVSRGEAGQGLGVVGIIIQVQDLREALIAIKVFRV